MTDEEVDEMMKAAEANKEEDKKRKEEADLKNDAEQLCFQTESTLKDFGDKVSKDDKDEIEDLIKKVREELAKSPIDQDDLKDAKDKLQEKVVAISSKVYEATSKEEEKEAKKADKKDKKSKDNDNDIKDADYKEE